MGTIVHLNGTKRWRVWTLPQNEYPPVFPRLSPYHRQLQQIPDRAPDVDVIMNAGQVLQVVPFAIHMVECVSSEFCASKSAGGDINRHVRFQGLSSRSDAPL